MTVDKLLELSRVVFDRRESAQVWYREVVSTSVFLYDIRIADSFDDTGLQRHMMLDSET
jgi:hypothetical protein